MQPVTKGDYKTTLHRNSFALALKNSAAASDNLFADRITTPKEHQRVRAIYDELELFIQGEKGFNTEPKKITTIEKNGSAYNFDTTLTVNPSADILPDRAAALNTWIDWVFDGRSTIDETQYNKALFFRYTDPRYGSIENFQITQGTVLYFKPGESILTKEQVYKNLARQLAMQHPKET